MKYLVASICKYKDSWSQWNWSILGIFIEIEEDEEDDKDEYKGEIAKVATEEERAGLFKVVTITGKISDEIATVGRDVILLEVL